MTPLSKAQLPLDQRYSLKVTVEHLRAEFDGAFDTETVQKYVYASYDQFAARAKFPNFLPLLSERFARQRLRALAQAEGHAANLPTVLFVGRRNAGRSQMALGFFQHLAGDQGVAWSGGSDPGVGLDRAAVEAMRERGIEISREFCKPWTDEIVRAADVVVDMGCDPRPDRPVKRYEKWPLPALDGHDVDAVRAVRDEIEQRVRRLLSEFIIQPLH